MLSCETSLRCVNKRYEVSIFAQFCAFEQEFRAVVFVYFQETYTAPDAVLSKNVMNKKLLMRRPSMIARAVLEKVVQLSRTPRKMHARKNVRRKEEGDKSAVM